MIFVWWHKLILFLVVASVPGITLLLRGVVWGSDSFAYWALSCGNVSVINNLHSPDWFYWFVQNVISCDLYRLALIMFLFYLFALCAVWIIGKHFFGSEGWRLPVYLGSLTPLFFLEALRFEPEFFGWTLGLCYLGVILLTKGRKPVVKGFLIVLSIYIGVISVYLWLPSILIILIVVFLFKLPEKVHKILLIAIIFIFIFFEWGYLLRSFNFNPATLIAEEIPLLGLAYVIYILPFWKRIPKELFWYALFLLSIGIFKSKYMFLVVPLLLLGLLDKQLKEGIKLKRSFFDIKEIPVLYLCVVFLFGMVLAGVSLYPGQSDMNELKTTIQLAKDNNLVLYNVWGDGWILESLGYDTNYKISFPNPTWNRLKRPYLAWNLEDIDGCERISKRTQQCN